MFLSFVFLKRNIILSLTDHSLELKCIEEKNQKRSVGGRSIFKYRLRKRKMKNQLRYLSIKIC